MANENSTKPAINITPLIDILLVLLIIFMVASPLSPAKFEARLPSEPNKDEVVSPNPLSLVVTVNSDSTLALNGESNLGTIAEPHKLLQKLSEVFQARRQNQTFSAERRFDARLSDAQKVEKTIFVKAPRRLPYGEVTKLVDALKGSGANPIGLQLDDLN